ncbi:MULTISPECIES: dynamin family protein [Paenibacillus]|uniref:dynamin family protein n=1 Tax=Paenibacillus TaxID=44249 RepID=UPI002FE36C6B
METITDRHKGSLMNRIAGLETWFTAQGDRIARNELFDLKEKFASGRLTIAFCGHFSAGKSSLINTLCGKTVLPAGPLPTTANVASLQNGAPKALLIPSANSGGHPVEIPLNQLAPYCRDGTAYERVALWDDIPLLGEHGVLLDTPGVDSGEESHAAATNSALHLADVVFYVMDYNHVLSESNLGFARRLVDWGKPLYLVVNQIDKHREQELSFETYRRSVEQAFELWGIAPAGVFYISLKDAEHPENRLPGLKLTIRRLLEKPEPLLEYSVSSSLHHSAEQYLERRETAEEEELDRWIREAGGPEAVETIQGQLALLQQEQETLENRTDSLRSEWTKELEGLLDSAYLMTPALREAAGLYLESLQPGFKTGLMFHRDKTKREQQRRSGDFLAKLKEQTDAQVDWHVRDLLRKWGRSLELWNPAWESRMEEALPKAEEAWISGPAREGAMLSGEYTLRYTADVAAGITGRYRRAALSVAEGLLEANAPRLEAARAELAAQREALLARSAAAARVTALRAAARERAAELRALLGAPPSLPPGLLPEVRDVRAQALPPAEPRQPEAPAHARGPAPEPAAAPGAAAVPPAAAAGRRRLTAAAAALEAAAEALAPYPAFGPGASELRARAAHLRGGRFTVALFGAFSAGKSSFANALLGAKVLPVSPHPTTAAINRILAPTDGIEHGQAVITFKSRDAMQSDLAYSFEALQLGPWKERTWRSEVKKLRAVDVPPSGRAHYSFLKAADEGWNDHAERLGKQEIAGMADFASFVAEESKACFVDGMDLYYSCPLTEQGIVIVDTPGADSIHARHTGVTFQYMKNCDALIYVTYYNHAFSRADRQFLAHLGRVKGNFALDKMFFVVNAADLAASPEELDAVVGHVSDGLRTAGIDQPQIFAVSSLSAQAAKETGDAGLLHTSGFSRFESRFFDFLGNELAGLAVLSAKREFEALGQLAREWSRSLLQSREERRKRLDEIREDCSSFEEGLRQLAALNRSPLILQEAGELLFHVRQRLRLLAGDLFQEFFHPSLLQEDGGDFRRKFAASFRGWLAQLSMELERELQATSLRLERICEGLLATDAAEWRDKTESALRHVPALSDPESGPWETPEIAEGVLEHRLKADTYASYFKNPKSFFEGGGKQKLREALEQPLAAVLKEAVESAGSELGNFYATETARRFVRLAERYKTEWKAWESGLADMAEGENREQDWHAVMTRLDQLLDSFK